MLLLDDDTKHDIFTQLDIDPEHTFKILKPLGEGAYGAVFKALDTRDDQLVALKVMRFDPEECQDLLSEIKILRECNNDFIVNFKDTFHKDGNIWLAMEFCEGGSALDIVKVTKHTLSERQCQCVLYHSLKGLQYLHSKNLIHRDIKAANILINKDGRCKLADFGVAKSVRASGAGTTIGSPYWMAPEVLGTEKYDNSADIWSLGIVAIEMAIGKPPLSNYKPLQAMFMIPKNDPPTIPDDYIDDFSAGFIQFIAKCLAKNPIARPTAAHLLQTDPWIRRVANGNTVEKELMPWIQTVMPLIEKDRDLKARMANQDDSYDDSKWSDYTASLQHLSRDGSTSNIYGGTMVKNGGDTLTNNNGTLKIVPDDIEDDTHYDDSGSVVDVYGDNGGTLVRKATHSSIRKAISNDDDDFDGGTMITVQTKDEESEEDEEEEDEYHENGFSPSSHTNKTHETQATNTTAATEEDKRKGRRTGGGYSIGNKSSFDGGTMVRQNSTDDEEEDPFQGQTMYRAPTVDSPRGPLLSDDDDSVIITKDDDDDDNNIILTLNDNDTVTSMGTTKPAMSVSPKNAFIAPNAMMMNVNNIMSDDEETAYENTRGYVNKPSSPLSGETKSQPPMAKIQKLRSNKRPSTPSDTPQPNVQGTAGVMGGSIAAETKGKVVRSGRISGGTHDVEIPTSPIPPYKHIEILSDNKRRNNSNYNVFELAILANELDFSKLVNKISLLQHLQLILSVLTTWIFIVSYITLECSDRKRPREMQLFIFSSALSILFNLVFNPFYFAAFSNKYIALNIEDLFAKTQPTVMLRTKESQVLKCDVSDDGSDDTSSANNNGSERPSTLLFSLFVWFLRLLAIICALTLSYFIYLDLSIEEYSDFTRYCIVALTLTLFVGNLPLMGHCLLYFGRVFLLYYFSLWLIIFGSEFAYFHFVRHVEEEYFHTFFLMNGIFLLFHLIATKWFSYMIKHRSLYLMDPSLFPWSNHYRVSIWMDGYIKNSETKSDHYRSVSCCCNKLICDSHTLLRFQSYASAICFWSFLGIIYTVGADYVILSASLFLLINTLWNPLFYSKYFNDNCLAKCLYYTLLICAYCIGFVLNIAWCTFSISAFILEDGKTIQHSAIINICIFLFTTFIFFLPSIGYSFYRIPISYAVSNIFSALFCFFIPILISFRPYQDMDTLFIQDWFFIYNNKYIVCAVITSTYLAFTGFSCVGYRLRKVLVSRRKLYFQKEFAMNMIMFCSFLLSLTVLCANTIWVFGDNFGNDPYDSMSIISKIVFGVMCCAQSSSLLYALFIVKYKFDDNDRLKLYLSHATDKIRRSCGCCCFALLYPIIYVSYVIFIIAMSICLGITKLLTIRQVRELWLSFLIAHYDDIKQNTTLPKQVNTIQTVPTHSEHTVAVTIKKQISLGETNHHHHPRYIKKTDEIHRRVSSTALQSINMKVFKCCHCCTPNWMSSLYINEALYNNYLMSELIVEAAPLFILNLVNMFLLNDNENRITIFAYIQAICSAVFLSYSICKTLFYARFHEWDLAKFL